MPLTAAVHCVCCRWTEWRSLAELVDTLLLILRKAPVIPLHWYHHATVLLYCWHSYAARIGTGLWYAAMNYSVHAIMYFYFGLTQCGPTAKKLAKRASMLITLLQVRAASSSSTP